MAKFRIGRRRRRRYGGRKRNARATYIARRYANAHRRLLRRAYAGKRRRRYRLKYNASRVGIPNKVSVKLPHFCALVLPATGGPWNEWDQAIDCHQLLTANNIALGIFNNSTNAYPLGFATYARLFNYYRVNAVKIQVQLAHKLPYDIHVFMKWVNNSNSGNFYHMDYNDMMVHRGITHFVVKAWNDNKDGETQLRHSFTASKKYTTYAHHSAVLPQINTKSGAFDKYTNITSSTFDATYQHYLYVITDGPVQKVTDTTNLPMDADSKWWLYIRTVANVPGTILAEKTSPPFVAGEQDIIMRLKMKWYMTWWRMRAIDDQEVDHTENDLTVCTTGQQLGDNYVA